MSKNHEKTSERYRKLLLIPVIAFGLLTILGKGGGGGGSSPPPSSGFSVSGTIATPSGTAVDSDVNDPEVSSVSNDTQATAQQIENPVLLGGYVNVAGAGPDGNSKIAGDLADVFRTTLAAGQTVRLDIADPAGGLNDLDLGLDKDCDGSFEQTSLGVGTNSESLTVAVAGDTCIGIEAFSGASNYVLSIGQAIASAGSDSGPDIAHDFVPGEVIVRFHDTALPAGAKDSLALRAATVGLSPKAGAPGREMLLRIPAGNLCAETFRMLGIAEIGARESLFAADADRWEKWDTLRVIKALRKRADVRYAEPNYIRRALATPNDQFFSYQWHYPLINLPQAWDAIGGLANAGTNVTVAVIDTGVVLSHPDLAGRLVAGFDFISNPLMALDGDGPDVNPDDPGDQNNGGASSFHGTHVAGTIAAATNNTAGVAAVAGQAKIMPLRVLGQGGGTSFDILEAVRYAAGLATQVHVDNGNRRVDIMNLSLGGGGFSQAEQDVYTQARNRGVIIIAAAGNDNSSTPGYPASYSGVVSVSAVDMNKAKAPYSNFGQFIDVAAPGGDTSKDLNGDGYADGVLSTHADDSSGSIRFVYGFLDGTSMAAPHAAGVAALMEGVRKAALGDLTPADLDAFLASGSITTELGAAGRDDIYGHGLIDAHKAVVAAAGAGGAPAALVVTPQSLNFASLATSATISVANGGGGALSVTSVTDDQAWLTVAPASVDASGLGTYTITVNRTGLADGTYTGKITLVSSANTVTVNVIMQKLAVSTSANAGRHYILLVDPQLNTVDAVAANAVNGQYAFSFSNIAAGSYFLFAGSDTNNDGFICDAGEACGGFPTLDQPQTITLGPSVSGRDFATGYVITIGGQSTGVAAPGRPLKRNATRRLAR